MHLFTPIRFHEPWVLSPSSYHMSESTTGLVDHLLHSQPTGTQPVHFPVVWPTFSHLVNTFSSFPLLPKPSLTCLGPSLWTSLSHLRPPHISWLPHHSQDCCSTSGAHRKGIQVFVKAPGRNFHSLYPFALTAFLGFHIPCHIPSGDTCLLLPRHHLHHLANPFLSLLIAYFDFYLCLTAPTSAPELFRPLFSCLSLPEPGSSLSHLLL